MSKAPMINAMLLAGSLACGPIAIADEPPPPANPAAGGHHSGPAWAACKKQADDQKLAAGDARREFMKNCVKAARGDGSVPTAA
ncbi:MAG TPA: PsiF family protein [Steroidobacteraceae bacterium]|jgi:hypothetical protein